MGFVRVSSPGGSGLRGNGCARDCGRERVRNGCGFVANRARLDERTFHRDKEWPTTISGCHHRKKWEPD